MDVEGFPYAGIQDRYSGVNGLGIMQLRINCLARAFMVSISEQRFGSRGSMPLSNRPSVGWMNP